MGLTQARSYYFQIEREEKEEIESSEIFFGYFDNDDDIIDGCLGPFISNGFLYEAPDGKGCSEFRSRIQKMIDEVKKFAKQICKVFMSPGDELVVFDPLKERLWASYIFYAERIPELYDYLEDLVFSGTGPVPEFLKTHQISFP